MLVLAITAVMFSAGIVVRRLVRERAEYKECLSASGYWNKERRRCRFPPAQCPLLATGETTVRTELGWCELTLEQLRTWDRMTTTSRPRP